MKKMSYTWAGKDLRLIDLLSTEERKQVIGFMSSSERRYRDQHVTGDASEFLQNAHRMGVLDNYEEIIQQKMWPKMLESMGHVVATAMDGRRDVVPVNASTPLRGSIPPGAKSDNQIALEFIQGLQADGIMPSHPVLQKMTKPVFVSKEFAEYLRANGELVQTFERDLRGEPAFVWPAVNESAVVRTVQNFQLASFGANEPDSGQLAQIVAAKAPKQYAAWKTGVADQWRMLDALRDLALEGAMKMTSGAYADKAAGAELQAGLTALQGSFQMLAEDAASGTPRRDTAARVQEVGSRFVSVGLYFESSPIKEPAVRTLVTDAVDLAATIADDLMALCDRYERDQSRPATTEISAEAGLA